MTAENRAIRVFHGDRDDIIPLKASQSLVTALEEAKAREVKFTRYADSMHDSWTETYNNPELYRWMLGHRRHVKGDEEGKSGENNGLV